MCRADVRPETVLTAKLEIKHYPSSKISKFYNGLRVHCSNLGCNQFILYSQLTQHELFKCLKRNIRCPAEGYPCVGRPNELLAQTLNCPLHHVYCIICDSICPVTVYGINCNKFLQVKRIINSDTLTKTIHLTNIHIKPNDSFVLPNIKTHTRHDEEARQTILNVVHFNRKRVIFGRDSNISETESNLPPAPPAFESRGLDEVDLFNEQLDMLDTAHDITFLLIV